eukprot:4312143-Alexandrium_andersonii.AAC.1
MSASLVGSEMCIRDSGRAAVATPHLSPLAHTAVVFKSQRYAHHTSTSTSIARRRRTCAPKKHTPQARNTALRPNHFAQHTLRNRHVHATHAQQPAHWEPEILSTPHACCHSYCLPTD